MIFGLCIQSSKQNSLAASERWTKYKLASFFTRPCCRHVSGIFVVSILEDVAGDFPGGTFPAKMEEKNSSYKFREKLRRLKSINPPKICSAEEKKSDPNIFGKWTVPVLRLLNTEATIIQTKTKRQQSPTKKTKQTIHNSCRSRFWGRGCDETFFE